jgi:hypothetical protein
MKTTAIGPMSPIDAKVVLRTLDRMGEYTPANRAGSIKPYLVKNGEQWYWSEDLLKNEIAVSVDEFCLKESGIDESGWIEH